MNLKRRLHSMEKENLYDEPQVLIRRTLYEARDGSIAASMARASIRWSKDRVVKAFKSHDETLDEFDARVRVLAGMSWQEARK